MKTAFKFLPIAVALFFAACSQPTNKKTETSETEISETDSAETVKNELPTNVPVINSITGVVMEIQPGKDGYTAKVKTTRRENVFVTVSRVNLKDPESYRSVQVGDTLQVIGEEWEMNGETHLKALEIKQPEKR